jgi:two-component system NtrC family sensor kinase
VHSSALDREEQERLLEAARLATVGRLMRPVAHELSTPLAAIALRAESLERAADEAAAGPALAPDKHRRYLKAMTEESQRCRDLLSTVREFAGAAESGMTSVDLVSLCRGAARLVSHEAMRRQIEIRIDGQAITLVRGQSHSLAQAVLALLLNAVDASPQGGKVAVEVRAGVGEVSVAVEDQGGGIPEEIRERLFQPFVSTRGPAQGLGLGLMACRAIAEMHGGSIDWRPNPPRGTRFVLRLPSGRPSSTAGEPRADA